MTVLGDRYELGELLGQGGMAEVRLGTDRRLGRTVAVKLLRVDLIHEPTFLTRFRREALSTASLNHPGIVAVYDSGEEVIDGVSVPYIVMEYVEGRTLRDALREDRRILPERALEITASILEALEVSHRHGIVHRDIKPGNVMLTPSGDVKVMDFGIARAVADATAAMTQTSTVIGTAQYISPEQARGEKADARSDIYSTGCLLYELLTGRPPFVADSPIAVAYQHVQETPAPPGISPEIDAVTLRSLEKRPDARYQTAEEMRNALLLLLGGEPQKAMAAGAVPGTAAMGTTPDGSPAPGLEPGQGNRRKYALAGIGAAAAVAVVGAAFALVNSLGGTPSGPGVGESGPTEQNTPSSSVPAENREQTPERRSTSEPATRRRDPGPEERSRRTSSPSRPSPSATPGPSPTGDPDPDPTSTGDPGPDPTPTGDPGPDPTPTGDPGPEPTGTQEPDPGPTEPTRDPGGPSQSPPPGQGHQGQQGQQGQQARPESRGPGLLGVLSSLLWGP